MYIFFDTETTGKLNYKLARTHPSQPRLVQLGAILRDNAGVVISQMNAIVRPIGFEIPEEASKIHGISTDAAIERGVAVQDVLHLFNAFCQVAHTAVGHNIEYDEAVLSMEADRLGEILHIPERKICTMKSSTDLCQLPGNYGYKWPKLQELHEFLFSEPFAEAHDAFNDILATMRCFDELRLRGVV